MYYGIDYWVQFKSPLTVSQMASFLQISDLSLQPMATHP